MLDNILLLFGLFFFSFIWKASCIHRYTMEQEFMWKIPRSCDNDITDFCVGFLLYVMKSHISALFSDSLWCPTWSRLSSEQTITSVFDLVISPNLIINSELLYRYILSFPIMGVLVLKMISFIIITLYYFIIQHSLWLQLSILPHQIFYFVLELFILFVILF